MDFSDIVSSVIVAFIKALPDIIGLLIKNRKRRKRLRCKYKKK